MYFLNYLLSLFRILWLIWLWLWLCASVCLWVIVLLFPRLPDYLPELERWVSSAVGQSITVEEMSTYWIGWQPTVAMRQVRWLDSQSKQVQLEIAYLEVTLDLSASWSSKTVQTSHVKLNAGALTLVQGTDGSVTLAGLPTSSHTTSDPTAILLWLSQQPDLSVGVTGLTWLPSGHSPVTFSQVQLAVQKQGTTHLATGIINLPEAPVNGVQAKRLSFQSTFTWQPSSWSMINTQWVLEQPQWTSPQASVALSRLEGQLLVKPRAAGGWQLEMKQWGATPLLPQSSSQTGLSQEETKTLTIPFSPLTLQVSPLAKGGITVTGRLPAFSLDKLSPFITPKQADFQAFLQTLQGTLQDVEWVVTANSWQLQFRFLNLTSQSYNTLPGFDKLSGQVNLSPRAGKLQFEATHVSLPLPQWYQKPLALQRWHGKLQWQRLKDKWQLTTPQIQFWIAEPQIKIEMAGQMEVPAVTGGKPKGEINIVLHDVQLANLRYSLLAPWQSSLNHIQFDGTLPKVQLLLQERNGQLDFKVNSVVKQVHINYIQEDNTQVELKDWSGRINFSANTGSLQFDHAALTLNFPHAYSHSLSDTRLQGQLAWEEVKNKKSTRWHLTIPKLQAITHNMPVQVSGSLDIPQDQNASVQTNLKVTLQKGQLADVAHYLPDRLWPKVIQWFEEAQMQGEIQSAKALLRGPLNALFEKGKSDRFQFEAQVNHAHFNYAKDWPSVSEVNAKVVIQGLTLQVTTTYGKLLNHHLRNVVVKIPNLDAHDPQLDIVGKTRGPAIDGLRFIDQSPLHKTLDLGEKTMDLEGEIELSLKLVIWLSSGKDAINGKIYFKNNKLHKQSVGITVTDITGTLTFNNKSVSAPKMRGKLFGKPVKFSIQTLQKTLPKRTRVQLTGQADSQFFAKLAQLQQPTLIELPWDNYLSGKTSWQAILDIPAESTDNQTFLQVDTDLAGLEIRLPAPLGKMADQSLPLTVQAQMFDNRANSKPLNSKGEVEDTLLLQISYADRFHSAFKINHATGLERGRLFFGTPTPKVLALPAHKQLTIQGHLPPLSVGEWQTVLNSLPLTKITSPQPGTRTTFSTPISLDLQVDAVDAMGQKFTDLILQANYTKEQWQVTIMGTNIEGQINYRSPVATQPPQLTLTFNQLTFTWPSTRQDPPSKEDTNSAKRESPDPQSLPWVTFYCRQLQVDQINLGTVNVSTQTTPAGLDLLLESQAKNLNLLAKMQWEKQKQLHETRVQGSVNSDHLGQLLQQFGMAKPPLQSTLSQLIINAQWPGSPETFNLSAVSGRLSLLLLEGQIVEVEPGIGRFFGLFDLQALPRRLALDFSDVFGKGLAFTSLVGFFSIQEGLAHTDHLVLQGPIAHLEIGGKTDLVNRQYDQVATVIPHVSNALPVAGAVAGGVGGGVAAAVVQQVLRTELENTMSSRYRVFGSWEKPQIEKLPSVTTDF